MEKVKFNQRTMDSDTREEYEASTEFVEVSESFAKRLKAHSLYGKAFVFQGDEKKHADDDSGDTNEDEMLQAARDRYEALTGDKAGRKGLATLQAGIAEAEKAAQEAAESAASEAGKSDATDTTEK